MPGVEFMLALLSAMRRWFGMFGVRALKQERGSFFANANILAVPIVVQDGQNSLVHFDGYRVRQRADPYPVERRDIASGQTFCEWVRNLFVNVDHAPYHALARARRQDSEVLERPGKRQKQQGELWPVLV